MPPVEIVNPDGGGRFLLTGDHAGKLVPSALGTLGVAAEDMARHIGWDIGVEALGRNLAARLDAIFVRQRYSRLVIDCNRDPGSAEAMPVVSDGTPILGNVGLSAADRHRRVAEIHEPYQAAVAAAFEARPAAVLVALHSFTPAMAGVARPWHIGVLHDGRNDAFARRLLDWLERHAGLPIGDNDPYRMDATDYTVPHHAFAAGRPYVELEVRQDLVGDAAGVDRIAALLAAGLNESA
ncbi:N-formylglutamate amidohydrolase [Sphingosinicellaceae bacterium]|nr:N-formylglutamate amidohydrolase [Sphingosinicellaceae bacterium]